MADRSPAQQRQPAERATEAAAAESAGPSAPLPVTPARVPWAFTRWFVERTAVLLITGALLYLLGLRGLLLIVTAFVISGFASVFLLAKVREAAAGNLAARSAEKKQADNDEYAGYGPAGTDRQSTSHAAVGVQPAGHQVDPKEVDQETGETH